MLDTILMFFFNNILILSLIFWALAIVGESLFRKKNNQFSEELFECGFSADHSFNLKINVNLFFVINLLILYDVEFLFLVPYFYNLGFNTLITTVVFFVFCIIILCSFFVDWSHLVLFWHN